MGKIATDETNYQNIANAIRQQNGASNLYKPAEMAAAILALSGGGIKGIKNFKSGTFKSTGTRKGTQKISCGFRPDAVLVKFLNTYHGVEWAVMYYGVAPCSFLYCPTNTDPKATTHFRLIDLDSSIVFDDGTYYETSILGATGWGFYYHCGDSGSYNVDTTYYAIQFE